MHANSCDMGCRGRRAARALVTGLLAAGLGLLLLGSAPAGADEATELSPLNPVPELNAAPSDPAEGGTPYDSTGVIDVLEGARVIIDDTSWRLAEEVAYYTADGQMAAASRFTVGTRVGFKVGDADRLVALWFLEP